MCGIPTYFDDKIINKKYIFHLFSILCSTLFITNDDQFEENKEEKQNIYLRASPVLISVFKSGRLFV